MPPQRNRERTFTGGPQGDEAWVKLRMPTANEIHAFQKMSTAKGVDPEQREEDARKYIVDFILDWNYVGDSGEPLPKPHKNPSVVGLILSDEFQHIFLSWTGKNTAAAKITE